MSEEQALPLNGWMVAWTPSTDQIEVGPWPDKTGWSSKYERTSGSCFLEYRMANEDQQVAMIFIDFHTIVVRDLVPPSSAHSAFLRISEYRRRISPDIAGALD